MRDYIDRSRDQLMRPLDDPWELGAILRAADQRPGRDSLLTWAAGLDPEHPALKVIDARFGLLDEFSGCPNVRPLLT